MSDAYLRVQIILLVSAIIACKKIIPKIGLYCEIKHPPHPQRLPSPLSYSGVIRVKIFVLNVRYYGKQS